MSELSDVLMVVTILGYLTAMVLHAAQYAFGDRGVVARVAARPARQSALVGAGAGSADTTGTAPDPAETADAASDTAPGAAPARRSGRLELVALGTLLVAGVLHAATVVTRGIAAGRLPWGNMYEFILTATLIGAAVWLWVSFRQPSVRHLGLFVALVQVLLLGLAFVVVYSPVGPLVPALDSSWFVAHIAAAVLASGIFVVGFVTAVLYLLRDGYDRGRRRFPYPLGARVPSAESMERLTFRLVAFAFPIWTFAIVAGAIWAEAAWSRYWAWDPKEVWAFITWVVYAAYLHARATPSVSRRAAAWLSVVGMLALMMNLFGVNLFADSLHSYA